MIEISYIITPLVAGVIGYITNDIAIRMLFRPHRAKYILGYRIPFTPGLIPKEKGRIAASIGQSISENLMNQDVLRETLLCDEMREKVLRAIDNVLDRLRHEETPLRVFLARYVSGDVVKHIETAAAQEFSSMIATQLRQSDLGKQIAHIAVEHALAKMRGGVTGLLGMDRLASVLQEPAEGLLAKHLDEMIQRYSPELSDRMVSEGISRFLDTPVSAMMREKEQQLSLVRAELLRLYTSTIEKQLPRMLDALDIRQIVEKRIDDMDVAEVEHLLLALMDKELKAIVWFGAALGFLIGCLNCFVL